MMTLDVLLGSMLREPQPDQIRIVQAISDLQQVRLTRMRSLFPNHPGQIVNPKDRTLQMLRNPTALSLLQPSTIHSINLPLGPHGPNHKGRRAPPGGNGIQESRQLTPHEVHVFYGNNSGNISTRQGDQHVGQLLACGTLHTTDILTDEKFFFQAIELLETPPRSIKALKSPFH